MVRSTRKLSWHLLIAIFCVVGCREHEVKSVPSYKLFAGCGMGGDFCFADQTFLYQVNVDDVKPLSGDARFNIDYGDGTTEAFGEFIEFPMPEGSSTKRYVKRFLEHNYEAPGNYTVQVKDIDGRVLSDTTIVVHKAVKSVGPDEGYYFPEFIWQSDDSKYHLVHTVGTQIDLWVVSAFSSSFDLLDLGTHQNEGMQHLSNFIVSKDDDLYVLRYLKSLDKYRSNGELIFTKGLDFNNDHRSIYSADDKLYIASDSVHHPDRFLLLSQLDMNGNVQSSKNFPELLAGPFTSNGDLLAFNYQLSPSSPMFSIIGLDGTIKTTKPAYGVQFHPVEGGVIVVVDDYTNVTSLVKLDQQGDKVWELNWVMTRGAKFDAIAVGNDTYVFFEDMQAAKIDASGKLVWKKHLRSVNETFGAVVLNKDGNFTVAGLLGCSYTEPDCDNYGKQFLIEIDKNGDIIDH